jgi:CheY-like chemotaxis protein
VPRGSQISEIPGTNANMRSYKILLVDDDDASRTMMGALLRTRGHIVTERKAALGTVAQVADDAPDVVLLDVFMPALSGESLANLLKRNSAPGRRPVVLLISAMAEEELAKTATRSGADGYVTKGSPKTLAERVEQAVAAARPPR